MIDNADRVRRLVVKQLGVDDQKVTDDASFYDDLGADSLDFVEIVMSAEEEFHIEIPDADAEKMKVVKDLIDFVDKAPRV